MSIKPSPRDLETASDLARALATFIDEFDLSALGDNELADLIKLDGLEALGDLAINLDKARQRTADNLAPILDELRSAAA